MLHRLPIALLALVFTGCGPKAHPLQSQRDLIAQAASRPAAEGWAPMASVGVAKSLRRDLLDIGEKSLKGAIPDGLEIGAPMIGTIRVDPLKKDPKLTIRQSKACDSCIRADVTFQGELTLGNQKKKKLPWNADAVATFRLDTADVAEGQAVVVRPDPDAPSGIRVKMPTLPPLYEPVANGAASAELSRQLTEGKLSKPTPLLTLPTASGIRVNGLRVKLAGQTRLDLSFATLKHGEVGALPDPGEGFVAVLPEQTLLGLIHAGAVQQDMVKRYAAEPTSLQLSDGGFTLGLRVWKAAKKPKFRDYTVQGEIVLGPKGLAFKTGEAQADGPGWKGPVGAIVNKQISKGLEDAAVRLPTQMDFELGGSTMRASVDEVVADDGVMVLRGTVSDTASVPQR